MSRIPSTVRRPALGSAFPSTTSAPKITLGSLVLLLVLSGCAAGSPASSSSVHGGLLAQFLLGIWHGVIAPATLLLEVINRLSPGLLPWTARFYEARGTAVEYDVGFYLGLTGSPLIAWSRWTGRTRAGN